MPELVAGLWAQGALGFIGGPAKAGKTWVALSLALSAATGARFAARFDVPHPGPVLYLALEGHRAAIRARVGALARGLGLNPDDSDDLEALHIAYKPPGINLTDPGWARELIAIAANLGAVLTVVDVLRAGARLKENDAESFGMLRANLQPLAAIGTSCALCHHFGKLTETQRERQPGERMAGSGAMHGALDAAIYITGSEDGGRRLRLEFDSRDIATPDPISIALEGTGTGPNGGLSYRDHAAWAPTVDVSQDDLEAPPAEIYAYVAERGGEVRALEVRAHFDIAPDTLTRRLGRLRELGITYESRRGSQGSVLKLAKPSTPKLPDPTNPRLPHDCPHDASTRADIANETEDPYLFAPIHTPSTNGALVNTKTPDLQGKPIHLYAAPPTEEGAPMNGLRPPTEPDPEP